MNILFLVVGLVVGALVGWLLAKNSNSNVDSVPFDRFDSSEKKLAESETARAVALRDLDHLKEKLATQQLEFESLQKKFSDSFENLANRIFEEKSKKFTLENKNNIDIILTPLREKITDFEKKVDLAYKSESAERNSLRGEIKNLMEASSKISVDAGNLAKALKGDQKMHGNWGELILDKVLERSGLTEGVEFKKQVSLENEEGRKVQPDVIVYLPEHKHLIIDSKVSLVAYEAAVNAESDEDRTKFLKAHLESLKVHIKGLSDKNYSGLKKLDSPDFVLMFLPIEASFSAAIQEDAELFAYAWDRNIVLVSPSTLLATLRTIASLWTYEKQARNVLEIAEESGKLYDKFVLFMNDLLDLGKRIEMTQNAYQEAMKKISTGTGNLISRTEKIKTLGAKTSKSLPQNILDRATKDE